MAMYGYVRVSSRDQNVNRQVDALCEAGLAEDDLFIDRMSGATFDRPAYRRLLARIGAGDVLVVTSIDRLGRNYDEILCQWRLLTREKRADVVVLDMPLLDTRSTNDAARGVTGVFIADIVLQLLSYVAQVEREHIKQRQAEGIAAARARGVRFGRPELKRPESYGDVARRCAAHELSVRKGAAVLGVSRVTFSKWLAQDGLA